MHQAAGQPRHPQHQRVVHALGHAGAQQDLAQQHEERDRHQQEVVRRAPRRSRPWRATAAASNRWPTATRPSTPRPAATGTASASRPMRMSERDAQHQSLPLAAPDAPSGRGSRPRPPPRPSACRSARAAPRRSPRHRACSACSSSSTPTTTKAAGRRSTAPAGSRSASRAPTGCASPRSRTATRTPQAVPGDQGEEADEQRRGQRGRAPGAASAGTARRANRCGYARDRAAPRRGPRPFRWRAHSPPARRRRRSSGRGTCASARRCRSAPRRAGPARRRTTGPTG